MYGTEPRYNEIPVITSTILPWMPDVFSLTSDEKRRERGSARFRGFAAQFRRPQREKKTSGTQGSTIQKHELKMYLDITNKCQHATKDEVVFFCF